MSQTFLIDNEDMEWLSTTHLRNVDISMFECAILHGNEDCPTRIELYTTNNVGAGETPNPTTYVLNPDGLTYSKS